VVPIWPIYDNDICPVCSIMIRMAEERNDFFGNLCHNIVKLNVESDEV